MSKNTLWHIIGPIKPALYLNNVMHIPKFYNKFALEPSPHMRGGRGGRELLLAHHICQRIAPLNMPFANFHRNVNITLSNNVDLFTRSLIVLSRPIVFIFNMKQENPTCLIDLSCRQLYVMSILNCRMLCHFAFVELKKIQPNI